MNTKQNASESAPLIEEKLHTYKMATDQIFHLVNNLNNLLAVMRGNAQLAHEDRTPEHVEELISSVLTNTSRARHEIKSALDEKEIRSVIPEAAMTNVGVGRILVVDDEESVRILMQQILTRNGHEVSVARNAKEAMDQCQGEPFDIVFMDLRLGETDGVDVFRSMCKQNAAHHVIFLSGDPNIESIWHTVRQEGADGFIKKPFDISDVNNAVAYILALPAISSEPSG